MPYLIDGHNLVPHLPGINLTDLDDENALVDLLLRFARERRTRIEVYFDKAPVTSAGKRSFGLVAAHFVREGSTADQAIKNRLKKLGGEAKNWVVVTSDREILVEARSQHSRVLSSAEFAGQLLAQSPTGETDRGADDQPDVPDAEVDYWLEQFDSDS